MAGKKLIWLLSGIIFLVACKKDTIDPASENTVTTLAGGDRGFADGSGVAARFDGPVGMAIDASGNIFVADEGNYRIRKVSPAGSVTTLTGTGLFGFADGNATQVEFYMLHSLAVDGQGNVYVTDRNRIRKITPLGQVTTLTSGVPGQADGNLNTAQFNSLEAITIDASGHIYVADMIGGVNPVVRIRKIAPDGTVSTLPGQFSSVYGLTVDPEGTLYLAEYGNYRIRKITAAGVVSTLCNIGKVLNGPADVSSDGSGNIYVATSQQVYKVSKSGTSVVLVAGGNKPGFVDGNGKEALFGGLSGIVLDAQKNIFVLDYSNNCIRKITMKN